MVIEGYKEEETGAVEEEDNEGEEDWSFEAEDEEDRLPPPATHDLEKVS